MSRIISAFVLCILLVFAHPLSAQAVFECPWAPVAGNNPSADGCHGGIAEACGTAGDSEPDIPCEQQQPPKVTSPAPDFDYAGAINQAKNELIAEGEDLTGNNCGKIVERACRYMPGGAGLLAKNYGAQYNGHSIDYIVMPDGRAWDVVVGCGDSGGGNAGIGNSGCCGPADGGVCEPNDRYIPCP
ncbi:MAG TPA: hypothetical protein VEF76_00645 [Patescibacteria group bacterium]|nr:hypothetical protein [Patescibacteria group bacterium]